MKNQLNKILQISFIILFFGLSKSFAIEDVSDLTNAINDAREEFNNISEGSTEQSKIIDEAIKEIDKATEYVQNAIDSDNAEDAIKTLEFIERSLTDVEKIIPQEFGSDMSNIDPTSFAEEDMKVVTEVTKQMNAAKEEKQNKFMSDLVDLNLKGIDTVSISENLNGLGIDTIELVLDVEGAKDLEKWTKEDWANSYKGSILTSAGSETVSDKEIDGKVIELEQKLDANNVAILDKRTSITELQTKIDPLSNQITDLKTQKTNLLAKYNEEILKQSSTILSDEEISQSKELADQFNNQLSEITNDIEVAEAQSKVMQQQIQDINEELNNQIAVKTQLENNIRNLNNQLSVNRNILSAKTSELNQLKNTDLNLKAKDLNDRLERVTLKRDFAQRDFDKSLDKEVEAFQRYYAALGNVDADNYDLQAEYAVREVQNILNPDPKEYRAFEYEKYAKLAGLSQSVINEGLNAIENDDWDTQKKVTKKILRALEKNPQAVLPDGYYFTKATDGDINVMIAEDKAIQEAVYTSIELNNTKEIVNSTIEEKTKNIRPLAFLGSTSGYFRNSSFNPKEGTLSYEFFEKERVKVISGDLGNKFNELSKDLSEKQNQLNQLVELDQQRKDKIKNLTNKIQKDMDKDFSKINNISSEINKLNSDIYSTRSEFQELEQTVIKDIYDDIKKDTAKIYDTIYGNAPNMDLFTKNIVRDLKFMPTKSKEWNKFGNAEQERMWRDLKNLEKRFKSLRNDQILKDEVFKNKQIVKLNTELNNLTNKQVLKSQQYNNLSKAFSENSSKIMNIRLENQTPLEELNKINVLRNQVSSISMEKYSLEKEIDNVARKNLDVTVKNAVKEYNRIAVEEERVLREYENKISSILKEIPTFENKADSLVQLDPVRLRAKLVDLAGEGNINESRAVEIAFKELGEIGDAPVSEYMTGPYWESSNIKTAAMVRSKKYGFVDDYDYMSAYNQGPLPLDAASRAELEGELKGVLGSSNPILDALNQKVESISGELNLTKEQSQNLTAEISKLENELSSLKNSENAIQAQINDLSNQFNSKESLIAEKTQNLASLQDQLNPISKRMNALQGQRAELDTKLNDQLSTIANQVKNQGQASDEANKLKTQFENQIAQLDNQLKQYETQSVEINGQLTTLTTELSVLETENPEIANQIKSLNKDLENFVELKADLAMATAKKLGLNVNENTLKSVKVVEGKVVVSLEGTNLVSIVDREMLIEDASKFIDPTTELSINTKLYTAGALDKNLVTREFVEAAKSISASAKVGVIAEATAIDAFGATTEQSAKYASAKAKRLAAREDWDAAMASGDKAAAEAAEAAFMSARDAEQAIGLQAAAAVGAASSITTSVASEAAAAASAAADAVDAVQESTEIASAAADAGRAAQQAALDALWELEALPGSSGMHTLEVTAAIRQLQAEMNGNEYNYLGASSYEEAMQKIAEAEAAGKNQMDLVNEVDGNHDPNRMGKCGQASC